MELLIFAGIACAVLFIGGIIYQRKIHNWLQVTQYEIVSEKLKYASNGDKIAARVVLLADLHDHEFGFQNEQLIREVRKQKPDLIIIAGDMFVKAPDFKTETALHVVRELVKICPVFYGNGNHERKVQEFWEESRDKFSDYKRDLESMGVHYLLNESLSINIKGNWYCVTGLDLDLKYYQKAWKKPKFTFEELETAISFHKPESFHILIAHNPEFFKLYSQWGADLTVSGHVHGGIIILPFLGGMIAPDYRLFPRYDFGFFQERRGFMVLSRGLGVHTIKFRLFNRPELPVIILKSK